MKRRLLYGKELYKNLLILNHIDTYQIIDIFIECVSLEFFQEISTDDECFENDARPARGKCRHNVTYNLRSRQVSVYGTECNSLRNTYID